MSDQTKTLLESADDLSHELRTLGTLIAKAFRIDVLCDFLAVLIRKVIP